MADAFAPRFSSEVRFNQPVEAPSMITGLASVASGIAGAFVETKKKAEQGGPTYAQAREQDALSRYTRDLSELQQKRESGGISDNQFKISMGNLNKVFASEGYDVFSPSFDKLRVSITGLPSETMTMTSTQMIINDLQATPEGQGRIKLAEARLVDMGEKVNNENVALVIQQEEQQKAELAMINVRTESDFAKAEPTLRATVQSMAGRYETSLRLLEQAGLNTSDPELLQNTYLDYIAQRQEVVAKLPLTLQGREEKIKALFGTTDAFFERLGVTENGQFTRRSQKELDMVREGKLALELVQADPEKSAILLEGGYADPNFTITPKLYTHLSTVLAQDGVDIKTLVPNTPAWIAESGVIITNDMVSVAIQLQNIGPQMLRSASEMQEAFKSQVGEEVWSNWSSKTAEESWSSSTHYGTMLGGYDPATIRSGQADTKAVTNNLVGLATSFAVIDLEKEPVSFGGVRESVSSQLPAYVDALEQVDPQNGKAARAVLFTSLGMAARQYEAGVTTAEDSLGVVFDPKKRTYTVDASKLGPDSAEGLWLAGVIQKRYGGDIIKAVADNFSLLGEDDIPSGVQKGQDPGGLVKRFQYRALDMSPSSDEVLRLLDMRNSLVYLDGLAGQLEPKDFKDARELLGANPNEVSPNQVLGAQALEAVATAPRPGEITQTTLPDAETASGSSSPVTSVVDAGKGFTVVRRQDGTVERIEGTRAWRNNNPGNIEYGDFAKGAGAVGTDGRFAVFPTYEAGRSAKKKLLWETRGYAGKTIAEAINRYAPPVENDTNAYVNSVASAIGVPINTPMSSLSEAQKEAMLDAMEIVEGFRAGKITAAQAGSTESTTARPTDANAVAAAAGGAAQRAIEAATPVSMAPPAEANPADPVTSMNPPAEAALPEQVQRNTQPSQASQEEAARTAPVVDTEVAALIDEIAGNPDKTYASERELLAAQQRGELEPGDTIIVDGVAYMVRKDGTPKRLGVVGQ